MSLATKNPNIPLVKVMFFIDGGYLKKWITDKCKKTMSDFDFGSFGFQVIKQAFPGGNPAIIIRAYFYDGLVDPTEPEYTTQKKIHENIVIQNSNFEVKTGRLIKDGKGNFRQKGVDVLMAIDMIDKAYQNQYDVAMVVAGDLDHLETIKTVKNRGKQVFGIYDKSSVAKELKLVIDSGCYFDDLDKSKFLD